MVLLAMVGDGAYDCRESGVGVMALTFIFLSRLHHRPEYCDYRYDLSVVSFSSYCTLIYRRLISSLLNLILY
ncbi:hypothetical protein H5410_000661 [Solanum commersonii]|uniref:Uncharacterized protein n=1 Tax=Solanum commersonii TaxID=4109 RepID=A0A9J6AWU9_SOLCO|nr:hypothetical protein H5410_000661 [Solanum commersonii]